MRACAGLLALRFRGVPCSESNFHVKKRCGGKQKISSAQKHWPLNTVKMSILPILLSAPS
jgi:hypothetical protein